jgi:murein DD-endopeptidase MepM/ murein hydrolase activator NlpD
MKIIISENQIKNILEAAVTPELYNGMNTDVDNINKGGKVIGDFMSAIKDFAGTTNNGASDTSLSDSGMMNPLGKRFKITSNFGNRNIGIGSKNHKGVDIAAPSGTPIYAPKDGVVLSARDTSPNGCGGFIELKHDNVFTKFCHVSRWTVNQGSMVKQGQVIGYTGGGPNDAHRGSSTGSHLHYEILNSNKVAINPLSAQNNLV